MVARFKIAATEAPALLPAKSMELENTEDIHLHLLFSNSGNFSFLKFFLDNLD